MMKLGEARAYKTGGEKSNESVTSCVSEPGAAATGSGGTKRDIEN
jgi:hypothetical protein